MKKLFGFILILFSCFEIVAQPVKLRSNSSFTQRDHFLNVSKAFSIPSGDTTLNGGLPTPGSLFYDVGDSCIYVYTGTRFIKSKLGISATSPLFFNPVTCVISSQAASSGQNGYMTTGEQDFLGNKTLNGNLTLQAAESVYQTIKSGSSASEAGVIFMDRTSAKWQLYKQGTNHNLRLINSTTGTEIFHISPVTNKIDFLDTVQAGYFRSYASYAKTEIDPQNFTVYSLTGGVENGSYAVLGTQGVYTGCTVVDPASIAYYRSDHVKYTDRSSTYNLTIERPVSITQTRNVKWPDLSGNVVLNTPTGTNISDLNYHSSELTVSGTFLASYNVTYNKMIRFTVPSLLGQQMVRVHFGGGASNDGGIQSMNYKDFYFAWDGSNAFVINTSDAVVSHASGVNYLANNLSFGTPTISSNVITIPMTILSTYNVGGGTLGYRIHVDGVGYNGILSAISFN